jgi:hypothetical protein
MDYVHSRSIPSNPGWDVEAMGDNGTEIPPSASKFILVTISPLLPIHIYLSTTDVMCIKNAIINTHTNDNTSLKTGLVKPPKENKT